ncbi:MAG TPA: glycosyltransferase family 1 protein [Thermoanaerobaculia bacterium]|nr:glycosyltransferase family 1 protein [Thermoanaerobaculia bacterium]
MKDPLVLIDGRPLVGHRTGIGVHTAEIARRLRFTPAPVIAAHAGLGDASDLDGCRVVVDKTALGVVWQQMRLPEIAAREEAAVVWGPHGTLPLRLRTPAVVSIHDLTSITMPHRHRIKTVLSFNLLIARSLEMAEYIAAVSLTAASEIMRGFGVRSGKITIVPNGVDEFFSPGPADGLPARLAGKDYLLYVGTLEPRKGIDDLVRAWRAITGRPRLVLCGSEGWGHARLRSMMEHEIEAGEIIMTGYVDRTTLRALYRGASALVYPSRFEGFGLPPLEAMACGTPVVATAGGAIREVVGDAAELVEVGDIDGLRQAIMTVLANESRRLELIARGHERVELFRWDTSAHLMRDLLRAAAR